jgi:hypothetical protein
MMNYTGLKVALSCSYHDFLASNPCNKISIFKETVVVVTTFFDSVVCLLISKVFQQMSEFQRSGIIAMREWGFSLREIGRRLGIHHSTPLRICRAWSEEGLCQHFQGITTNREDQRLQYMTKFNQQHLYGVEIYRRKTLLGYMLMALVGEFR